MRPPPPIARPRRRPRSQPRTAVARRGPPAGGARQERRRLAERTSVPARKEPLCLRGLHPFEVTGPRRRGRALRRPRAVVGRPRGRSRRGSRTCRHHRLSLTDGRIGPRLGRQRLRDLRSLRSRWQLGRGGAGPATGTACVPRFAQRPRRRVRGHPGRGRAGARSTPRPSPRLAERSSKIDTRTPHDDMHDVDRPSVLGRSRSCRRSRPRRSVRAGSRGPVVDQELEAKSRFGDQAAFIHMEVYNENNPSKGIRPQLEAYGLPTEPWLFVIDRHGIVRTRIEGAFGIGELGVRDRGGGRPIGTADVVRRAEAVGDGRHTQVTRGGRRFSGMFICMRRRSTRTASVALMAPTPRPRLSPAPWRPVSTASRPTSAPPS